MNSTGSARQSSSLDEILALDGKVIAVEDDRRAGSEELYPELNVLQEKVKRVVAFKAAEMLGIIRHQGEDAAKAHFCRATYCRLKKILEDSELLQL